MKLRILIFGLIVFGSMSAQSQRTDAEDPPRTLLERYCEMEIAGRGLTIGGWEEMAGLMLHPVPFDKKKLVVIKDFVVSKPVFSGGKAELYVEYIYLGQLNSSSGRFSRLPNPLPPAYVKVRVEYDLVQIGTPPEWKIEPSESGSVMHISVPTAIHYLDQLRNGASDATVQRNAEHAIATLKRYSDAQDR